MTTYLIMQTRIASELRRSNLTTYVKDAINDAIKEAARDRFYFNEVKGATFNTVSGTAYYAEPQDLVEIDAMYYLVGTTRYPLFLESNSAVDAATSTTSPVGPPQVWARHMGQIRLSPTPEAVYSVYMDGYGRLTPTPLVADADTNAWMTEGERYIRALAKSILLKDVIRDFGEAAVYEAIAEDQRTALVEQTTLRLGTGAIQGTKF